MENERIKIFENDLKKAELKKALITEAISTRLLTCAVTADQLVILAEVLKDAEMAVDYHKDNLNHVLAESEAEKGNEQ